MADLSLKRFSDFPVGECECIGEKPEIVTVNFNGEVVHTGLVGTWKDSFPEGAKSVAVPEDSAESRLAKLIAKYVGGHATTTVTKVEA